MKQLDVLGEGGKKGEGKLLGLQATLDAKQLIRHDRSRSVAFTECVALCLQREIVVEGGEKFRQKLRF